MPTYPDALRTRTKCSPTLQTAASAPTSTMAGELVAMGADPSFAPPRLVVETPDGPVPVCLGEPLAEGGIGVVHAGTAPGLGPLAIKVLHERHAADPGIVRRFEREVEHAGRLCHPNVISVLGAGRLDDGRPFFAMERLRGATLGAVVRRTGPLSIARGLRLADQLLAGLAAVHDAGLVHRDLSPDNVFLAVDEAAPERERAVILDFGFAQEPGVDAGDGLTPDSPGSLVGTITFMSPEQATRGRAITARSDLFAAAVLLYYAFSGKLPFRGHDDLDVLVSVVRAAPIPLRRERRDAPPALEEILGRALAKHPDARFAGARAMREALLPLGDALGADPESPPASARVVTREPTCSSLNRVTMGGDPPYPPLTMGGDPPYPPLTMGGDLSPLRRAAGNGQGRRRSTSQRIPA